MQYLRLFLIYQNQLYKFGSRYCKYQHLMSISCHQLTAGKHPALSSSTDSSRWPPPSNEESPHAVDVATCEWMMCTTHWGV